MLKSICRCDDGYRLVKETIKVNNKTTTDTDANNANKKVICNSCAPLTNCISEINNRQLDNARDTDKAMSMYN